MNRTLLRPARCALLATALLGTGCTTILEVLEELLEEGGGGGETRDLLDRLPVQAEQERGYDRDDWPHWRDLDDDCMDARQEVLLAESLDPPKLSKDGCKVSKGRWLDPYTGKTFTSPKDLDVDHMVPLEEAHQSGGYAWDRERRQAYANDLDDERTLIAVSKSANRSKGSKGPESWMPEAQQHHCQYVAEWVAIKVRWGMTVDAEEKAAIAAVLDGCGP